MIAQVNERADCSESQYQHREFLGDQKMKHRSKRSEHNSIVQEFAVEAIRCGADMIKVVNDEGYEEVYMRKDNMDLAPDSKAAKAIYCEENSTAWRKRSDDGGRQRGIRVARMHL